MKLFITYVLAFGQMASAADWIMGDDTCDPWDAGVRTAMKEVQDLAKVALRVMDGNGGDFREVKGWKPNAKNVENVAKCILGKDSSFQAKWDKAKSHFQALTAYGEEEWKTSDGSKPKYNHAQWIAKPRSNKDAEIYCGHKRLDIKPHEKDSSKRIAFDPAMANRRIGSSSLDDYIEASNPNQNKGIRAFTSLSDLVDAAARKAAINPHPNFGFSEVPDLPDLIQLAVSTLKDNEPATGAAGSVADAIAGWPTITLDRVEKVLKNKKLKQSKRAGIDILQTLGTVLLHELTHTHTGGKLYDLDLGKKRAAYGWKRCKEASDPDNADSMVQLAVAWKVYSLGQFYVNDDGHVFSR